VNLNLPAATNWPPATIWDDGVVPSTFGVKVPEVKAIAWPAVPSLQSVVPLAQAPDVPAGALVAELTVVPPHKQWYSQFL